MPAASLNVEVAGRSGVLTRLSAHRSSPRDPETDEKEDAAGTVRTRGAIGRSKDLLRYCGLSHGRGSRLIISRMNGSGSTPMTLPPLS